MKRILYSLLSIGVISIIVVFASQAFFSDTETSTGNVFQAGKVDLLVDSSCSYNGQLSSECGVWDSKNLTTDKFFNFSDVKPGDYGENTISLKVEDNPSWLCMTITPTANDDVSSTEPELKEVGETPDDPTDLWDGELRQNMTFHIWADVCDISPAFPGDNIYQEDCDRDINYRLSDELMTIALSDSTQNVFTGNVGESINANLNYYIGFGWSLPESVGNIVQTDNFIANISFYAEQERNNKSFVCPGVPTVIFDDFNDGNIDGWEAIGSHKTPSDYGSWEVIDQELLGTGGGDGYMMLIEDASFTNQVVEVDANFIDPAGYGVFVLWYQDYGNLVFVKVYPGAGGLEIFEWENGVETRTFYPYYINYHDNLWYNVKAEVDSESGELNVYINGIKEISQPLTTTKRFGSTGLMNGNSGSYFDNFRLSY